MKESVNIINRFSDAYLIAMMEGANTDEILRWQETDFPELSATLREEAQRLELLYGYLRKSTMPSDAQIASAYAKVSARIVPLPTRTTLQPAKFSLVKAISSFFSTRPIAAGASLAVVAAVVLAIIIYPTSQTHEPVASTSNREKAVQPTEPSDKPAEIAQAEKPSTDMPIAPTPAFRGGNETGRQDKAALDKKDRERLAKLHNDNTLAAPTGLKVAQQTGDTIILRWNPVKNALSYIVEIKRANEATFTAVSQTSQTQARIAGLPTSERVEVRVIAASGERKGEPAAMTVSVP